MVAYYNEIDPFAAQWLRNLIQANLIAPGVVDERDIRDVRPLDLRPYTRCHFFAGIAGWDRALHLAGWPADRPVWTGSCPCQPFSQAGARRGFADERHLWPYWQHLIRVCRPATVLGEQVAHGGLPWLELVLADLEACGYAVGAARLCAAGVGAPHERNRLWFVAHADGVELRQQSRRGRRADGERETVAAVAGAARFASDAHGARLEVLINGHTGQQSAVVGTHSWSDQPGVGSVLYGVPDRMDKIRALGNAIVPQVAAEFIRAVMDCVPPPIHP